MKIIVLPLCLMLSLSGMRLVSQDSIPVIIHVENLMGISDTEWIHLEITDTVTQEIWYDTLTYVLIIGGFDDTIYLDSGVYKCEILDMGADVGMPEIILSNGYVVPWGWPECACYLFTLPVDMNTSSTIFETSCDSYISPSQKYTWTTSGTYMDTIPNAVDYDSVITINLTVNNSTYSDFADTACNSYISPSGKLWENTNIYLDTIPNANDCDSIITVNLTIVSIDSSVTQSDSNLTANEPDANYQWIVCNSGNLINDATDQSYTPFVSGLYSVRITKNGCTITSSCYSFIISNIARDNIEKLVTIFPNPANEILMLDLGRLYLHITIEVKDILGRSIKTNNFNSKEIIYLDTKDFQDGIYLVYVKADNEEAILKFIKE